MIYSFIFLLFSQPSNASLEACGKVVFSNKMSCEKPDISFDVSGCETGVESGQAPSKVTCDKGEMIATLKTKNNSFRAVFTKGYTGVWEQKGQVWRFSTKGNRGSSTAEGTKASKIIIPIPAQMEKTPVAVTIPTLQPAEKSAAKSEQSSVEKSNEQNDKVPEKLLKKFKSSNQLMLKKTGCTNSLVGQSQNMKLSKILVMG